MSLPDGPVLDTYRSRKRDEEAERERKAEEVRAFLARCVERGWLDYHHAPSGVERWREAIERKGWR